MLRPTALHLFYTNIGKNLKMKKTLFLILIIFFACKTDRCQNSIYGKWTTADVIDHTGLEISDEVIYYENGTYEGKILSRNDSVVENFSGEFEFREADSIIEIRSGENSFRHKLIEINGEEMVLELQDGNQIRIVRKK